MALCAVVTEAYIQGIPTGSVDDLVAAMGIELGLSNSEVSRVCVDSASPPAPSGPPTYPAWRCPNLFRKPVCVRVLILLRPTLPKPAPRALPFSASCDHYQMVRHRSGRRRSLHRG